MSHPQERPQHQHQHQQAGGHAPASHVQADSSAPGLLGCVPPTRTRAAAPAALRWGGGGLNGVVRGKAPLHLLTRCAPRTAPAPRRHGRRCGRAGRRAQQGSPHRGAECAAGRRYGRAGRHNGWRDWRHQGARWRGAGGGAGGVRSSVDPPATAPAGAAAAAVGCRTSPAARLGGWQDIRERGGGAGQAALAASGMGPAAAPRAGGRCDGWSVYCACRASNFTCPALGSRPRSALPATLPPVTSPGPPPPPLAPCWGTGQGHPLAACRRHPSALLWTTTVCGTHTTLNLRKRANCWCQLLPQACAARLGGTAAGGGWSPAAPAALPLPAANAQPIACATRG